MKILADGSMVSSRSYYFLLDYNDQDDWKTINEQFGKKKIKELDRKEYRKLFEFATHIELKRLES